MSIYKNGKLIAGGSQCMPLLSFMWADHILNDASWLRADTFSWQSGAVYQAAYQHLTADITGKTLQSETISGTTIQFYLADDGHKICPASQESNVTAIYNATGVAWYYIIDTTNQRFKLPRAKHNKYADTLGVKTTATRSTAAMPTLTWSQANGTNITSTTNSANLGALNGHTNIWGTAGTGWSNSYDNIHPDNLIAQQTQDTDQYKYPYFYVGQFTQTALENTAGVVTEDFNELNAHKVIAFQTPTSANNYTWYRKYADGWVEQGGRDSGSTYAATTRQVNLPVAMAASNYCIQLTKTDADSASVAPQVTSTAKTNFKWSVTYTSALSRNISWFVAGMAA